MKNIRAYLTIAVVSLMLVVVSAFSMSTAGHQAAVCVPLLFGLVFCWSTVKAMLAQQEEPEIETAPIRFTVLTLKAA